MGLGDFRLALEFREIMRDLVTAEVERQRPRYQMGTVTAIDRTNRRCSVQFPGEPGSASVNMGSVQPNAIGQVVRVEGLLGDRYVADVMGPAWLGDANGSLSPTSLDAQYSANLAFTGKGFEQLFYSARVNNGFVGGGIRKVTATGVSWSQRFLAMGLGRNPNQAASGFFDIIQPPDGTVIPGFGGAADKTVAAGEVPLAVWEYLYYDLPFGSSSAADASRFKVVSYLSAFTVPPSWVMVVGRSAGLYSNYLLWGDGLQQDFYKAPSYLNGWTDFAGGGGYEVTGYKKEGGKVYLQGLAAGGTINTGTTGNIFILPQGFRPRARLLFGTTANDLYARCEILTDGSVRAHTASSNAWFSLNGIFFDAAT